MKLDNPLERHFKKDMDATNDESEKGIIKDLKNAKTPAEILAAIDEHYTLDQEK